MTTYTVDFSDVKDPFDVENEGWTGQWHSTTAMNLYFWIGTDVTEGKYVEGIYHIIQRYMISLDAIDSDAERQDTEILARLLFTSTDDFQGWLAIRGSGTSTTETAYFTNFNPGANTIKIRKYVSATATDISSTSFTHSADTWYWCRFRVNSTSLKMRVWADGASEPGTWNIDTTDSAISGDGFVGFGYYNETTKCSYFSVGTNGDTAPSPSAGTVQIAGARLEVLYETGSEAAADTQARALTIIT